MKHKMIGSLAVFALTLMLSSSSPAAGKHPEIEDAIASLARAKNHLLHAANDFGGHKADAVKAIDEADRQLRICMQY